MLVTSEISMKDKDVYNAYHNLWRIEESFRIMKSQLDARPVYLQKQDTIVGHFLICYLAVLLTRLLQFKILKNGYSSEELFEFVRDFRVAKISDRKYINLSHGTSFIRELSELCSLPLTSYFLNEGDIKKNAKPQGFNPWLSTMFYTSTPKVRYYTVNSVVLYSSRIFR